MKIAIEVAANMPTITTVPRMRREEAPAPEAIHNGAEPKMKANEVIRMGRKRKRAPSSAASIKSRPFAKAELEKGRDLIDAALEGARLRLRPILMTSFAFIFGSAPLWIASGAGASSRRILGTVVIVGMLAATSIAIFIIPATFYLVEKFTMRFSRKRAPEMISPTPEPAT